MRLRGAKPPIAVRRGAQRNRQRAHSDRRQRLRAAGQPLRRVGDDGRRHYAAPAKFLARRRHRRHGLMQAALMTPAEIETAASQIAAAMAFCSMACDRPGCARRARR